tara:strand:+ start:31498 stop:32112 length:615 start_codon:yes stop_codon:yes gene_type:complete
MSSIGSNKKYPATINDKKNIIFENNNSKFHIPDKYKNFYIVSKKDYFKFKNELESIEKVNPILKNEEDKILDFDTYTIDSPEGIKFLKNQILFKKKYVRSDEHDDKFVYQPEKSIILNPVSTSAPLNPVSTSALLNPKQNVVILVKTKGGKKSIKSKKIRKHKGIIQTGGNKGRLRKGYKYSGKKLKNGMPEIMKARTVSRILI